MLTDQEKSSLRLAIAGYAWPGGYPVFSVMADGGILCSSCVKEEIRLVVDATRMGGSEDKQWKFVQAEVNWEDNALYCDHCNRKIEAAYGD